MDKALTMVYYVTNRWSNLINKLGAMFMEAKFLQPYLPVYSIDIGYG